MSEQPPVPPPYGQPHPPSYPPYQPGWPAGPPPPPPPPPYGWTPGPPPGPPRKSRTPLVLALLAAVVVLAAAIVVPVVLLSGDDEEGPDEARSSTTADPNDPEASDTAPPEGTSLDEVVEYDDLPTTHVPDAVDYEQTPPVGGPHFQEWLDCGVYDEPVPNENAVHDLEHGTVWITYDPALGEDDVALLEEALPQNGILSPYDGLPAPVVVTVWGAQLALTGADDPGLQEFIEEYDDGVTAPEPLASCAGGTAAASSGAPA